ncbi:hypothetical protein [Deinococcus cellulosilyticus]|uniref:Outer membrane protein beta-barrel domain-containing protein n=1 Tax=Deinococcus cellulosilyticus (strain DSM 18568 / NBRC 106333 / KACC 11606 / 5516J-15) TaxID=1223518 RepID=A0A511NA81_DEIC1|nr:hypothetical protein [Deinococcus cellulosilyticus]GEM49723.1 hypothetical protein DC3_53580 [Deinococcus cellulosilyticus NBRC 106333 = KACC 11606]
MRKLLSLLILAGVGSSALAANENWFSAGVSLNRSGDQNVFGGEFGLQAKDVADFGGVTLNTRLNGNVYSVGNSTAFNLNGDLLFNVYTDYVYGTRVYIGPRGTLTSGGGSTWGSAGLVSGVAFTNADRTFDTFIEGSYERVFAGGGFNRWGIKAAGTYHVNSGLDVFGDVGATIVDTARFGAGLGVRADLGNNTWVFTELNYGKQGQLYTGSGFGGKVGVTFKF